KFFFLSASYWWGLFTHGPGVISNGLRVSPRGSNRNGRVGTFCAYLSRLDWWSLVDLGRDFRCGRHFSFGASFWRTRHLYRAKSSGWTSRSYWSQSSRLAGNSSILG